MFKDRRVEFFPCPVIYMLIFYRPCKCRCPKQHTVDQETRAVGVAVVVGDKIWFPDKIQITKDGRIVVFHDDTMKRMCGNEGKISDYTYEELQQFHLGDSTEKIPLLREVLQTVDGRVPLLIEIKMPGLSTAVCAGFQKEMEGYTGMFCMESFNSLALRWCRRHMPQTLRGQLSGRFSKDDKVHLILRIMARHLMLNFIGKPDFIAYDHYRKKMLIFFYCLHSFPPLF